jgi:trans-aconitate 2-methyltransferase
VTAEIAGAVPGGFVLGVDASAAFVDYARAHYPPSRYPNLHFEQMDARRLDTPHRFDVIFSNAALHWVDDHRAFLAGCARLIRPGGKLVISCGGAGNAAEFHAAIDHVLHEPRWARFFEGFTFPYYFYSPEDYAAWLPEAGFTAERIALAEKDMTHAGADGLAAWLRTTWLPFPTRVPADQREAFIAECVAGYVAAYPLDAEGNGHVRMVRLEVEARGPDGA